MLAIYLRGNDLGLLKAKAIVLQAHKDLAALDWKGHLVVICDPMAFLEKDFGHVCHR